MEEYALQPMRSAGAQSCQISPELLLTIESWLGVRERPLLLLLLLRPLLLLRLELRERW